MSHLGLANIAVGDDDRAIRHDTAVLGFSLMDEATSGDQRVCVGDPTPKQVWLFHWADDFERDHAFGQRRIDFEEELRDGGRRSGGGLPQSLRESLRPDRDDRATRLTPC